MRDSLLLDFPIESSTDKISIKIADFGLARSEALTQSAKMTGFMGTFVILTIFQITIPSTGWLQKYSKTSTTLKKRTYTHLRYSLRFLKY